MHLYTHPQRGDKDITVQLTGSKKPKGLESHRAADKGPCSCALKEPRKTEKDSRQEYVPQLNSSKGPQASKTGMLEGPCWGRWKVTREQEQNDSRQG